MSTTASQVSGNVVAAGRTRRLRRRRMAVAGLALGIVAVAIVALMLGTRSFAPGVVIRVLTGEEIPGVSFTIVGLRLPRLVVGILAGAAFGMGGVVFQTMLRNALASPDIVGISAGASAAAVVAITQFGLGGRDTAVVATVAGLGAAMAIYLLAWKQGIHGTRLVLVGIGMGALLNAVVAWALARGHSYEVNEAMRWLTGSLNSSFWDGVPYLAIPVAVLIPVTLWLGSRLAPLRLGDDVARALGTSPNAARLGLTAAAVALVSVATAATGPIAFVAFLSGPIAQRLVRGIGSLLVPAALVGAVLVVAADFVGQNLLGTRFPVGVVTALIGAPYLVLLLVRANQKGVSL